MEKRDLALYIHIPYCVRKCDYCDFLSGPAGSDEQAYYVRVLQKEIRSYETLSSIYKVRTVFFGGGTPSILEDRHITRIVEQLFSSYDIDDNAEISIECNPGTLTVDKLKTYRSLGINRISMGVQSANDDELRCLGRIHTWSEFKENYILARRLGFDNINVDLMSGIPGQTMDSWQETLNRTVELEPDHISAYSLIIEKGTPFYERYSTPEGRRYLPGERDDRLMYHYTKTYLAERGYERYEISNYAKPGFECRHNLVYWRLGDYLGFGLGASSYLDGRRFSNTRDKDEYWESAKSAYQRFRALEKQPEKDTMEEYMFLGLRTMEGVRSSAFEEKFRKSMTDIYGETIDDLSQGGYLTWEDGVLRLTDRGIDVSNRVLSRFLLD